MYKVALIYYTYSFSVLFGKCAGHGNHSGCGFESETFHILKSISVQRVSSWEKCSSDHATVCYVSV